MQFLQRASIISFSSSSRGAHHFVETHPRVWRYIPFIPLGRTSLIQLDLSNRSALGKLRTVQAGAASIGNAFAAVASLICSNALFHAAANASENALRAADLSTLHPLAGSEKQATHSLVTRAANRMANIEMLLAARTQAFDESTIRPPTRFDSIGHSATMPSSFRQRSATAAAATGAATTATPPVGHLVSAARVEFVLLHVALASCLRLNAFECMGEPVGTYRDDPRRCLSAPLPPHSSSRDLLLSALPNGPPFLGLLGRSVSCSLTPRGFGDDSSKDSSDTDMSSGIDVFSRETKRDAAEWLLRWSAGLPPRYVSSLISLMSRDRVISARGADHEYHPMHVQHGVNSSVHGDSVMVGAAGQASAARVVTHSGSFDLVLQSPRKRTAEDGSSGSSSSSSSSGSTRGDESAHRREFRPLGIGLFISTSHDHGTGDNIVNHQGPAGASSFLTIAGGAAQELESHRLEMDMRNDVSLRGDLRISEDGFESAASAGELSSDTRPRHLSCNSPWPATAVSPSSTGNVGAALYWEEQLQTHRSSISTVDAANDTAIDHTSSTAEAEITALLLNSSADGSMWSARRGMGGLQSWMRHDASLSTMSREEPHDAALSMMSHSASIEVGSQVPHAEALLSLGAVESDAASEMTVVRGNVSAAELTIESVASSLLAALLPFAPSITSLMQTGPSITVSSAAASTSQYNLLGSALLGTAAEASSRAFPPLISHGASSTPTLARHCNRRDQLGHSAVAALDQLVSTMMFTYERRLRAALAIQSTRALGAAASRRRRWQDESEGAGAIAAKRSYSSAAARSAVTSTASNALHSDAGDSMPVPSQVIPMDCDNHDDATAVEHSLTHGDATADSSSYPLLLTRDHANSVVSTAAKPHRGGPPVLSTMSTAGTNTAAHARSGGAPPVLSTLRVAFRFDMFAAAAGELPVTLAPGGEAPTTRMWKRNVLFGASAASTPSSTSAAAFHAPAAGSAAAARSGAEAQSTLQPPVQGGAGDDGRMHSTNVHGSCHLHIRKGESAGRSRAGTATLYCSSSSSSSAAASTAEFSSSLSPRQRNASATVGLKRRGSSRRRGDRSSSSSSGSSSSGSSSSFTSFVGTRTSGRSVFAFLMQPSELLDEANEGTAYAGARSRYNAEEDSASGSGSGSDSSSAEPAPLRRRVSALLHLTPSMSGNRAPPLQLTPSESGNRTPPLQLARVPPSEGSTDACTSCWESNHHHTYRDSTVLDAIPSTSTTAAVAAVAPSITEPLMFGAVAASPSIVEPSLFGAAVGSLTSALEQPSSHVQLTSPYPTTPAHQVSGHLHSQVPPALGSSRAPATPELGSDSTPQRVSLLQRLFSALRSGQHRNRRGNNDSPDRSREIFVSPMAAGAAFKGAEEAEEETAPASADHSTVNSTSYMDLGMMRADELGHSIAPVLPGPAYTDAESIHSHSNGYVEPPRAAPTWRTSIISRFQNWRDHDGNSQGSRSRSTSIVSNISSRGTSTANSTPERITAASTGALDHAFSASGRGLPLRDHALEQRVITYTAPALYAAPPMRVAASLAKQYSSSVAPASAEYSSSAASPARPASAASAAALQMSTTSSVKASVTTAAEFASSDRKIRRRWRFYDGSGAPSPMRKPQAAAASAAAPPSSRVLLPSLGQFARSKTAFVSICDGYIIAQSASGLCVVFPMSYPLSSIEEEIAPPPPLDFHGAADTGCIEICAASAASSTVNEGEEVEMQFVPIQRAHGAADSDSDMTDLSCSSGGGDRTYSMVRRLDRGADGHGVSSSSQANTDATRGDWSVYRRTPWPHVFLNAEQSHVVHCTYYNRSATPPSIISCVSDETNSLKCFAVPLSTVESGEQAVRSASRRVFQDDVFQHPGVSFACVNLRMKPVCIEYAHRVERTRCAHLSLRL